MEYVDLAEFGGLRESDVFIMKNVLEVLPKELFQEKLPNETHDIDGSIIHNVLLSYKSRRSLPKRHKSTINLQKETKVSSNDIKS